MGCFLVLKIFEIKKDLKIFFLAHDYLKQIVWVCYLFILRLQVFKVFSLLAVSQAFLPYFYSFDNFLGLFPWRLWC